MSKAEKVSHVALTLVCVLALFVLVEHRFAGSDQHSDPEKLLVGKQLSGEGPWTHARLTVVAAMTTKCHYCLASMPFFKKLSDLNVGTNQTANFVIASPEEPDVVQKLLTEHQVSPVTVWKTPLRPLGITATPTILLVDSRGTIRGAFIGAPSDQRQAEILRRVRH